MTTPQETIWEIEPHTVAKHEILRRYLGAWFPILSTYNRRIVYFDGFCGPGRYKGGEPGSPIIALREALNQTQRLKTKEITFLFVDERPDRIAHLQNELKQFPIPQNFIVRIGAGQFDQELKKIFDYLDQQGLHLAPTFAFIDPFGFKGVPFDQVRRLLTNKSTEILMNVMVESINRFLEHPDSQIQQYIADLFGTPQVFQIASQSNDRLQDLRLLYQQQLSQCARFVRYFEMRDCRGRTIYYLFFASNHPLGHVKMKEAFWRADPSGRFCFSDATDPNQLVMFEIDETPKLAELLSKTFASKRTLVGTLTEYVENETAFTRSHMLQALRVLEEQNKIKADEFKTNGQKRRVKSFPDDLYVQFG